ncbi:cytochrome P450 61 [Coccidioides immitis RMSCC 3703]|uniref:Cytochrome P450 61 n=2 Tax=Coccidioides TaxID=5500 RepID=A0A0J8QZ18_COCIT|nr:cytochrome P450 61 [Coccidioides immitis RMSCC 3703]
MAMIGKASMMMDWEHHATPISEDIKVFATIFPQREPIRDIPTFVALL